MEKFRELDKRQVHEVEMNILNNWKKEDILNKTIENRKNNTDWVFYDGPATANGMPGLHHMVAKFLKDSFCKYQTMKGHKVLRKVGWDTHGLPVEVNVEKKLGFTGKNDIEKYGIEKFNKFIEIIKENVGEDIKIDIKNTICSATKIRQEETEKISKDVDCMIIIGGKNSSNTKKLYDIAKRNCINTFIIETKNEIEKKQIENFDKIGIMAGASTPMESINEVIEKITN